MARQASETASGAWTLLAGSERAGFNGSRRLTARDLFHVWRPVASSGFLPLVVNKLANLPILRASDSAGEK